MAFAPDGRLFVCQQSGQLRVIKNGVLLNEPFLTVTTDNTGERGLLGVAFDPEFSTNGFVYIYYTALTSPRHNLVSRFTAAGDVAVPGSEQVIFRLDDLSSATIHNGGAMHFGLDGKLYVAVGENGSPQNAQLLDNVFGKVLRLNRDGTIPSDNPFALTTTGNARAIWALGLRNPFTFDVQPNSGRIFINDVGEDNWEEINDGIAGANYGWPRSEGPQVEPGQTAPLFSYPHGIGPQSGCAVTGGTFYNPTIVQFPTAFVGKYFFADFCSGWIGSFDPATATVESFAGGLSLPVDLKAAPDGSLYYLERGSDSVNQIVFTGSSAPFITVQPTSSRVSIGETATFTVEAVGGEPLLYQWRRNGADIIGATSNSLTLPNVAFADDGAKFEVVVSNTFGTTTSVVALLNVTNNQAPVGSITLPTENTFYTAGDTIAYSGVATDAEDGVLPPSAFTWQVDFHHNTHAHPFIPPTTGASGGSFEIPVIGEKSANVWYRIRLKVTDSGGRSHESFRDILPRVSVVTLATKPAGLQVALDGQPELTPTSFTGVAGIIRNISTAPLQTLNGTTYEFVGWSDGGELSHNISTPQSDQTLKALFTLASGSAGSELKFSSATYEATESDPFVEVTVMRTGDVSASESVDYATANGTAIDRNDYLPVFGRLFFAPNESQKTIRILITNGVTPEDTESLNVTLFNASDGAALGTPNIASLTILDDDHEPPDTNPIDDAEFFVRQHYQDFLNREPDPPGLAFWTGEITGCGADTTCREIKRQNVSAAFFFSIEFQETGFLVYRLNQVAFARFPTFAETLRDTQQLGRGVIVGIGDWEARLEANRRQYLDEIVNRPEFLERFPEDLPADTFVTGLDENTGFSLSPEERDLLIAQLGAGTINRVDVLKAVVDDGDFRSREFNRAFVLFQYFGYLRRNPNDTPNTDFDGYEFWLNKLSQFNGNFERAEMVRAFLNSIEYRERFGP
jgi:glucose/arabinose dehydrogenase